MDALPPSNPPVLTWFRVYAGGLTFIYFALIAVLTLTYFYGFPRGFSEKDLNGMPPWVFQIYWFVLIAVCLVLGIAFLVSFFLPRKPWAWVYDLVLICIGFTSACCLPACIPLLIYWLKPEAKAYFGKA